MGECAAGDTNIVVGKRIQAEPPPRDMLNFLTKAAQCNRRSGTGLLTDGYGRTKQPELRDEKAARSTRSIQYIGAVIALRVGSAMRVRVGSRRSAYGPTRFPFVGVAKNLPRQNAAETSTGRAIRARPQCSTTKRPAPSRMPAESVSVGSYKAGPHAHTARLIGPGCYWTSTTVMAQQETARYRGRLEAQPRDRMDYEGAQYLKRGSTGACDDRDGRFASPPFTPGVYETARRSRVATARGNRGDADGRDER